MNKTVQIIGHRGACAYAPENTLSSFNAAMNLGVDSIETDIRITKDGVLVLIHDARIDRTSNAEGMVEASTYRQLRKYDFGSWFSSDFSGERILSFMDFLSIFGGRVHLNLEIKAEGIEKEVLTTIKRFGMSYTDYVITAFEYPTLIKVKALDPQVMLGYLKKDVDTATIDICVRDGIRYICPKADNVTQKIVRQAHAKGLMVRMWGIKNTALMEKAVLMDCDGMTIDFPDKLTDYLTP